MLYKVRALYREETAGEFFSKLTDGSIEFQPPDGAEILESMKRAKITDQGTIEWYETCYCATPLAHERSTVYDRYFNEIEAREVTVAETASGSLFWTYLEQRAMGKSGNDAEKVKDE